MRPKPFILCFENHRTDGNVWAVHQSRRWTLAPHVAVDVPLTSVYRGPAAEQPKAYFQGVGVIRRDPHGLTIAAH